MALHEIPEIDFISWRRWIIESCQLAKGRVISLLAEDHGDRMRLYGLLGIDDRGELRLAGTDLMKNDLRYPSLTPDLPEAHWFERELYEQHNILPEGHPWLKPIRRGDYAPFYRVEGEEIHEVAVGPVHAGIIEPGHFRFQCHGEKVFHLEIQLGYQHRGIETMFPKANPSRQAVLAESIAGDTVVGHALCYAHAMEGLADKSVSVRAKELRVVALELERMANHVGDLGMLSSDVGFLPASAYFGRLRGEFLNLLMELTGNRYGRSFIRPGGTLLDLSKEKILDFWKRLEKSEQEFRDVSDLFFSETSVLARFEQTGVISAELARTLGLVGFPARASGIGHDVRSDYPIGAYRVHKPPMVRLTTGDVYARARIRSLEVKRSLEFLKEGLKALTVEKTFLPCDRFKFSSLVVSLVEGWRGEIVHIAITDSSGKIRLFKIIDPSFHNWQGLQMAMRDGQISDFPLCNKSFNLSYAGHDL
ncbi:MAG: hypothetical protein A3I75_08260 [Deltaproteobacteria bacterium RIFCSPLOWO2_02_FULL_50_16]|nr:MAG: hypothetical protein A3B79_05170 [Deltaproteobacteria bacterium RIFCSPHIGHO2_02_FULL_50_15]OGQ55554.1 MAG: hypothetical protein A3I75_08260 [Deltaproteobacteria bacterium RIFCSPLOWO2_02_FULL_50_16]